MKYLNWIYCLLFYVVIIGYIVINEEQDHFTLVNNDKDEIENKAKSNDKDEIENEEKKENINEAGINVIETHRS